MLIPQTGVYRRVFILCSIGYLAVALWLLPYYRYQVNPDGISYIGIAYKYYHGNFSEAVNGYWGPLLSWLLAPLPGWIKDPLLAFRLLSIAIGWFTFWQSCLLLRKFQFSAQLFTLSAITILVMITSYVFALVTPDLLFAGICLWLVNGLIALQQSMRTKYIVQTALAAALLYFTKSYGFYFSLAVITVFFAGIFFKRTMSYWQLAKRFLICTGLFLLISLAWIICLTKKYDRFTIATAGKYNHQVFGPSSPGPPMYHAGLMDPPNATATSVREDLSLVNLDPYNWGVFDSKQTILHQWKLVKTNLYYGLEALLQFSWLSFGLLFLLAYYIIKNRKTILSSPVYPAAVAMFFLPLGYLLLILQDRYIWAFAILLLIAGLYALQQLLATKMKPAIISIISAFILISFAIYPVRQLIATKNVDKEIFQLAQQLKEYGVKGKIASQGGWEGSLYLAFHLQSQYYGECKSSDMTGIANELRAKNINYYLVWNRENTPATIPEGNAEITNGKIPGLRVYKISE